jgi:KUP system potassium uptake protein
VPVEERYVVNKVSAVEGFYTCTYYIGFRDEFDVRIPEIVERIVGIEQRNAHGDPARVAEVVAAVRRCAEAAMTHIVPHYHVVSKGVESRSAVMRPLGWVRKHLIESVYRHVAAMFPETKNWLNSADE